ncbi:dihydrolipoamide acetyltransferase family protein [Streptomyces sp. FIT100]|uniref:dihydrolipoamide acetyltransferase family protein n=1 Tax=Streptomyces sp. FIT100 TaxID=2837956 RepID=UPI0021C98B00|nr:dihydrolipoamide acetyltransferase family protein [Streptomyces sp. FIT100]UUN28061.1 2-oxo acid dehydrogenase subunit E2 [Streptomyces sp. FIT100]
MAQVLEFRLPDLGEGLTEAEIVRWLVAEGDVVAVDQPVVEVETAKAMVEVPCPYAGVVTARFGEEGTELPVGAPLLTVAVGQAQGAPGESGTPAAAGGSGSRGAAASGGSSATGASRASADEKSGNVLVGYGTGAPAARRRRIRPAALSGGADPGRPDRNGRPADPAGAGAEDAHPFPEPVWDSAVESPAPDEIVTDDRGGAAAGMGGAVIETAPRSEGPVAVISPLVRKLARDNGVDLRELHGSGPEGLILRADVELAVRALAGTTAPQPPAPATVPPGPAAAAAAAPALATAAGPAPALGGERIPLRGVRGAVAEKLSRSRREIPDATCWVDADATELMAARKAMNATGGPKISLLALFARICTAALARYPELNSTVDLDAREIVRLPEVHLGFAAQTPRGLVVPVVRNAHGRTAESLTEEFARLTETARRGALTPAELTGGTFTLNNYGVFGVDGSTPIINHPEAAMLGVGRIVPKPWVHEGELAVREVVQLSLTFDHRVCDGGTAGGFLRYVADCVESPAVLLRTL